MTRIIKIYNKNKIIIKNNELKTKPLKINLKIDFFIVQRITTIYKILRISTQVLKSRDGDVSEVE